MSNSDGMQVPDTFRFEAFLAGAKAAASLIPLAGAPVAEALGYAGGRYVEKQNRTFLEAVLRGLEDLKVQVAGLPDSFYATFLHAAEIARRTHQEEKREALKNIVLNAVTQTAPEEDLQHIFVNMVADLTPLHIRLLKFVLHPEQFGLDVEDFRVLHALNPHYPSAAWDAIETHVAGTERSDLVQLCLADMVSRGLLEYHPDPGELRGFVLPWPSNIAWEFMSFITSPNQESLTRAEGEAQHP